MANYIDTTPRPSFLRAMQNHKWTVAGALSELVDNSLGSARGDADTVWIDHDTTNRTLDVIDNGRGMDAVGRLFQLGNTIGRAPGDIGIYGSGGTMAILWLPSMVEVWTLRDEMVSAYKMAWPQQFAANDFFRVPSEWSTATLRNTPSKLLDVGSGTMIRCHLLRERSFVVSNVVRDLSQTYAPAFRNGKQLIWRTLKKGKWVESRRIEDPFKLLPRQTDCVNFEFALSIDEDMLRVSGCVGAFDDLPYTHSNVAVGYGHRVIKTTRDCYQSPDGSEKFTGANVAGWLDLRDGWQPYLSTTKDDINDGRVWDALMAHVYENILPILQKMESEEHKIILDDIAINLTALLNSSSSLNVDVLHNLQQEIITRHDGPGPAGTTPNTEAVTEGEPKSPSNDESDEGIAKPLPASSEIILVPLNDVQMSGVICSVEIDTEGNIIASINTEHDWVASALSKPVNRKALNYVVVRELASAIFANEAVRKKLFKPALLRLIEVKDDQTREQFMARLLLDRAA